MIELNKLCDQYLQTLADHGDVAVTETYAKYSNKTLTVTAELDNGQALTLSGPWHWGYDQSLAEHIASSALVELMRTRGDHFCDMVRALTIANKLTAC